MSVVVALLAIAGCAEDPPASIGGFPASIPSEHIGEEPEWARVVGPNTSAYFVRRRQLTTDPPAPVYDASGHLVGTFGCPTNQVTDGAPFTPIGEDARCSPQKQ